MKTCVLITGASGFIGRNLFEYFSKKDATEVFGAYRTRSFPINGKLYYGNLVREEVARSLLKEVQPDVLIHAAAATAGFQDFKQREAQFIHDNIVMNAHIIALAAKYKVPHVILLGCSLVYPSIDSIVAEDDVQMTKPLEDPYSGGAKVKCIMEDLAWQYGNLSGGRTAYTIIRHSNIYGPYDKFKGGGHLIAAKIAEAVDAHDGDTICVRGPGTERRDALHIDDFLCFVDAAISQRAPRTGAWNVGYGSAYSVNEIVRKIADMSGKKLTLVNDFSANSAPTQPALNCQKAKSIFGWRPKIKLNDGLQMTMEWYKANKRLL